MPEIRAHVVHETECPEECWPETGQGAVRWRTLFSADRTPTASLTAGVAVVEPTGAAPLVLHRHAQPEVYYILSGQGEVTIDARAHSVTAGSAVFIPGNALHGVRNTGAEPLRLLYAFAVDAFDEVVYVFAEGPNSLP